jgi:hypothetical protein
MTGLSLRNLKYMRAFAEASPDEQIVQVALAQITWYHNIALVEKLLAERGVDFKIEFRFLAHARRPCPAAGRAAPQSVEDARGEAVYARQTIQKRLEPQRLSRLSLAKRARLR